PQWIRKRSCTTRPDRGGTVRCPEFSTVENWWRIHARRTGLRCRAASRRSRSYPESSPSSLLAAEQLESAKARVCCADIGGRASGARTRSSATCPVGHSLPDAQRRLFGRRRAVPRVDVHLPRFDDELTARIIGPEPEILGRQIELDLLGLPGLEGHPLETAEFSNRLHDAGSAVVQV